MIFYLWFIEVLVAAFVLVSYAPYQLTFKNKISELWWLAVYCCGATEGSEQQHNQDLTEIYKGRRILEFITFYHNALHLTRVHCATNNSNKNTGKLGG